MKVLYIFRSLAVWGGIERVLVDKMNWLVSKTSIDVNMLTSDQGEHPIPYRLDERIHIEDLNINFHRKYRYNAFRRIVIAHQMRQKYIRLLTNRIQYIHPDIIVCTTAEQLDVITGISENIPLIVESHSICNRTIEQGKNVLLRNYYRYFFLKSLVKVDCVVSLTEGDAIEWRKYHRNVKVIPNLLHPGESRLSFLVSKRVIWIGRLDYQKRADVALSIWRLVVQKHPEWCLDIYGEGEMESDIKTKASLMNNTFVHKPTEQIFDSYLDSSILISTSLFEPFGLVIVEAMSCGLPVVAFDCPYGPADIITDTVDGFLVPFDNIHFFANRLCLLIEDVSLRKRMGQAAFVSSKKYDANRIIPKWEALFDELVKKQ